VLQVLAIIGAIGGVILGIVTATISRTALSTDAFGSPSTGTTHPYVGLGIAIALEALISGLFFWAIARGLQVIAVDTASRHGVNLDITQTAAAAAAAWNEPAVVWNEDAHFKASPQVMWACVQTALREDPNVLSAAYNDGDMRATLQTTRTSMVVVVTAEESGSHLTIGGENQSRAGLVPKEILERISRHVDTATTAE
jgi:hypothetical protein